VFAPGFVNYKKGCTQLGDASDKVDLFLVHDRWFSPGTPTSTTTKTGRHDIAEILLKVAYSIKIQIQILSTIFLLYCSRQCGIFVSHIILCNADCECTTL
jgi:hypothetical protein